MADTLYNNKSIKEPWRSARNRRQSEKLTKKYLAGALYRSKKDGSVKKISNRIKISSSSLYENKDDEVDVKNDDEIDVKNDDFDDVYIS
jgi:hypothetical protein